MSPKLPILCALAGLFAAGTHAQSTPPQAPDPDNPSPTPQTSYEAGYLSTGRNPTSVFVGTANSGFAENSPPSYTVPLQWGPFILDPHPAYGLFYTDGILVAPGDSVGTTRQSFSPGFTLRLGTDWTLDYTPTWDDYSNARFHDGFDQAAKLDGKMFAGDWNLEFSQAYGSTYDPLIETGRQTREDNDVTELRAVYKYAGRTLLELGVDQNIQLSPTSPDAYEWSTLDWLHRPLSQSLDIAVGGGLAYIAMDPGYDMTALRPQGRITLQATAKLSFDLQGGFEHRTFIGSGGGALNTPIYSGTATYLLTDATSLSANAHRDVEPGYALNQVDDVSAWGVGVQQRLLRHFFLGANIGRQKVDYVMVGANPIDVRGDDATTYQLSLNTVLVRRLSLGLQYSKVRNDSDIPGFGFTSNQYGLTIQYRY